MPPPRHPREPQRPSSERRPQSPSAAREPQRIAKLLARAGIASRRDIERMIEERRIAIDGVPVEKPATLLTSLKGVTVDGKPVKPPAPARLFRFHKPVGVLTAARDPKGRPTIYDRLPKPVLNAAGEDEGGLPRLMPVGRLDMNTEGLLLLTTDGELKRQLELPSSGVERTYRARVFGEISQERLEDLIQGIEIDGIRYGSIDANLERRTGRNAWVEMKLTEGKNREVRRVLEHLGLQVSRLIRTAYGPFLLGDLPAGAVDEVRTHDLMLFRKDLSSPGSRRQWSSQSGAGPRGPSGREPAARPSGRVAERVGRPSAERPRGSTPGPGLSRPNKRPDEDRVSRTKPDAGRPKAATPRSGSARRDGRADEFGSAQPKPGADRPRGGPLRPGSSRPRTRPGAPGAGPKPGRKR